MENQWDRSISGRIFSRSGTCQGQEDPFAQTLKRYHQSGTGLANSSGFPYPAFHNGVLYFDQTTLASVNYSVWFYRRTGPIGWWDGLRFTDALKKSGVDTNKPKSEPVKWYLAGAVLFCVDRSLASYQRGKYAKAIDWFESADALLGGLSRLPFDPVAAGRKGAVVRHALEGQLKNEMCQEFANRTWRSTRDAARILEKKAISRGKEIGFPISADRARTTVYEWLLEYDKNNPSRHGKG